MTARNDSSLDSVEKELLKMFALYRDEVSTVHGASLTRLTIDPTNPEGACLALTMVVHRPFNPREF